MTISTSALGEMWVRACEHADFKGGVDAHLYYVPGPATEERAIHLHPGAVAEHEQRRFPFSPSQLEHANERGHRHQHRIAIRDERDEVTVLARLRHELEHARQHRANPASYEFMQTVVDALSRAFHAAPLETLEGTTFLYNGLPQEADANRAAASCVRDVLGQEEVDARVDGPDPELFREQQTPDLDSLPTRLVAHCALFPEHTDDADLVRGLTAMDPLFAAWWSDVRPALSLHEHVTKAMARAPSRSDLANHTTTGPAWKGTLDALLEGERVAAASVDTYRAS